jgi:RNA 3'-terminal phosphate cyclase
LSARSRLPDLARQSVDAVSAFAAICMATLRTGKVTQQDLATPK